MPFPRFTKVIINHFPSQYKSLSNLNYRHYHTIKDDGIVSRLKFVRIREDYQDYGLPIPDMMLNDEIKQLKSYQMFIKSTRDVVIQDTPSAPNSKPVTLKLKLKGISSLTLEEQKAANTMQALKESKKPSRRHLGTGGSNEGTGRILGVPDESTIVSATSSEGTGTKPGVPDEEKVISEANVILEWGSENESEHSDDSQLNFNDKEKKDKDGNADDEGDDHISDTQDTDDEDAKTESDEDEIYKYKIRVRKYMDVEIAEAETVENENKEKDVMTIVAKPDVEKIAEEQGDAEFVENVMGFNYQVKESTEFLLLSSSLSVSFRFGTQFLNSSSDISLTGVLKDSVEADTANLPPIPEILIETSIPTVISPPHVTPTILIVQQTTTPIPKPSIITKFLTITTVVPESDAIIMVQLRVAKLEKDVFELKKIDQYAEALATLKSQVPNVVDEYLGSKLGDALQKTLQKHSADLIHKHYVKPAPESTEKQKMSKYTIKSSDKAALKEYDQKSILYQTMHENKSFNRNPANHALYHELMEALIEDENAMDKGVADTVKNHKRKHNDDDEDPPAGPNQGKKTKRRRTKDSKSSKKPSTTKETSKGKALTKSSKTDKIDWNNPEGDRYHFDMSKPLPLQGRLGHLTVAIDYFFNNDLEYLNTFNSEKTYTTSITKTKEARYENVEGDFVDLHLNDIEDMLILDVQHKLFHVNDSDIVDLIMALCMFTRSLIIKRRVEDLQLGVESYQKKLNITVPQQTFLEIKFVGSLEWILLS
ncbi:hypothetical protein Tco_1228650 [Tanacetum coccineum]